MVEGIIYPQARRSLGSCVRLGAFCGYPALATISLPSGFSRLAGR